MELAVILKGIVLIAFVYFAGSVLLDLLMRILNKLRLRRLARKGEKP